MKREGSYFSGRLQAPSFPPPGTVRAKIKVESLLHSVQGRPGDFGHK